MANITVPPVILRTTSDQAGHAHGVVLGEGMSAAAALLDLENKGGRRAEEVAAGFSGQDGADATWPFQIVDVTLIPVPPDGDSWCAAGTLASQGSTPWSGSYWDDATR